MAMCAPTFSARAVTAVEVAAIEGRADRETFRRLPGAGGLTGCGFTAAAAGPIVGWARAAGPLETRGSDQRDAASVKLYAMVLGDEAGSTSWAAGIAAAARLAVPKLERRRLPKVPAGGLRHDQVLGESSVDALAAIVTPASVRGGVERRVRPDSQDQLGCQRGAAGGCIGSRGVVATAAGRPSQRPHHERHCNPTLHNTRLALGIFLSSGSDVHPQLDAAGPAERRAAENAPHNRYVCQTRLDVDLGRTTTTPNAKRTPTLASE